jgi:hypothetical protein
MLIIAVFVYEPHAQTESKVIVIHHPSAPAVDVPPFIPEEPPEEEVPEVEILEEEEKEAELPQTPIVREARRLQKRLKREQNVSPPLPSIVEALKVHKDLISRSIDVHFLTDDDQELESVWTIALKDHPHWIRMDVSDTYMEYKIDPLRIRSAISRDGYPEAVSPPSHSVIIGFEKDDYGVGRAETTKRAQPGYIFNVSEVAPMIARALNNKRETMNISVTQDSGRVFFASASGVVTLNLLSTGHSDFAGSTYGRKFNVKKALDEHLNNILIAPGETLSFNDTLTGPVSLRRGWAEALGIFNGSDLKPTAGGGICQTSTTLYRALLHAGVPIEEQRNHSLYVQYYEKHGVGLDATIFPGSADLVFTNDTPSWMLLQAYTEGSEAFINIYGISDGRSIELEGPYFVTNAPKDLKIRDRDLYSNEIAWIQRITHKNGEEKENQLISRYKTLPVHILKKHANKEKEKTHL